ncbi:MAG: hypothetical protein RIC19_14250 [Phaeodactylibacter sp.]|uniref:hypothetical protein n=1 Tax=Phaeodactylibacter sp. TaxID=1940289 RepID=UPI0032EDD2B1
MQLKANSECADGDVNEEWFAPAFPMEATCYFESQGGRPMPINSDFGQGEYFTMCPDIYRATNRGVADYHIELYLRSPRFQAAGTNCSGCANDDYIVRFRTDREFVDVGQDEQTVCFDDAFIFAKPYSAIVDCL